MKPNPIRKSYRFTLIGTILLTLLSSCDTKSKDVAFKPSSQDSMVTESIDISNHSPNTIPNSDTCKDGLPSMKQPDYLFYKQIEMPNPHEKVIKWGMKGKGKIHSRRLYASPTLGYRTSNNDFIILSMSCGVSCGICYALPMNGGPTQEYGHPLALDLKRNLLAYIDSELESSGYAHIAVENLKTQQKVILKEYDWCPGDIQYSKIICSYFENKDFVISWNGSKCSDSIEDIKTRRIQIDF